MASPGIEVDDSFDIGGGTQNLSDAEKELIREELTKTENEIATLKQLLNARQKHASQLKRKLGLGPLSEITGEVAQGIKTVRDTPVYQKTSEVVSGTADAVRGVFAPAINDIRNTSFFKSFETKIGTAYTSAKMAASTSIDHLAEVAGGKKPNGGGSNTNDSGNKGAGGNSGGGIA